MTGARGIFVSRRCVLVFVATLKALLCSREKIIQAKVAIHNAASLFHMLRWRSSASWNRKDGQIYIDPPNTDDEAENRYPDSP